MRMRPASADDESAQHDVVRPVIPLVINEEVMDELLVADDSPLARQLDEPSNHSTLYAEYRQLVEEQKAVRRVGALVTRGAEPSEVVAAVVEEMRRCLGVFTTGIWRFDTSDEITMLAGAARPDALAKWPVGTRTPMKTNTLATAVYSTGLPARIDSYEDIPGEIAARVRAVGVRSAVGVPIIVDGSVWGLAAVGSEEPGPMPADAETRVRRFAELIATAVVAGYRDEQKRQLLCERSVLIDSVLEGRAIDRWSLCELAGRLRLPANGPYVIVAAEAPSVGIEALPDIESKLRGRDVYSAWRLLPDLQVGIVHVKSERRLGEVLGLVSRLTTNRVGVSARFDDLHDTPLAL